MAVLSQPDNPTAGPYLQEVEAASRALSVVVRGFDVRSVEELPRAFAAMVYVFTRSSTTSKRRGLCETWRIATHWIRRPVVSADALMPSVIVHGEAPRPSE